MVAKVVSVVTKLATVSVFLTLLLNPCRGAFADNLIVNGDFSNGWNGWTKVVMSGSPVFDILTGSNCNSTHNGNPAASLNVWSGKKGAIEQAIELPAGGTYTLSFREWGQYNATTVNVIIYDEDDIPTLLDTFTAEQLISGYTFPGPVFQCTPNVPVTKQYDISDFAGETIVLHVNATSSGNDGTFALFDDFTIEAAQGVEGMVRARLEPTKGVAGVTLHLTGTTTGGTPVDKTTESNDDGKYKFDVSAGNYSIEATGEGNYTDNGVVRKENGGVLSAVSSEGGDCEGTATKNKCQVSVEAGASRKADFSYTLCATEERFPNDEELTHCPIVLVPGFLGSRIVCNERELWPGLPLPGWGQMNLLSDGETNDPSYGDCNASADVLLGDGGILDVVPGKDIYQSAMNFLEQEAPGRWRPAPYDWRKSPVVAIQHLDLIVDSLFFQTYAKHVVLYGHSMGGLVIREYINNPEKEKKVARIVTAGTPYWGAPKSHFALLGGYVDTPAGTELDHVTWKEELQRMARNLQGIFFLYPSKSYGNWLSLAKSGFDPFEMQDIGGEDDWVRTLGANPQLLDKARMWHDQNDGFPHTDIDFRAVVGAGSPTVLKSNIRTTQAQVTSGAFEIGNGDGTVPLISATQGGSEGKTFGSSVPLYYSCGVGHVDLPGNSDVLSNIRGFLLYGDEITGLEDKCGFEGKVAYFPELTLGGGNDDVLPSIRGASRNAAQPKITVMVQAGSETLSLDQARDRGLIQFLPVGVLSALIIDNAKPVTVTISGRSVALQLQEVSSTGNGPLVSYKPVKGGVQISSGSNVLDSKGAKLKPIKLAKKLPTTKSTVSKLSKGVKISLSAKAPNGLLGTFYRIGSGKPKIYKKAFRVNTKKSVKVSYYSVDLYGFAEKWKSVKVKR